MHFARLVSRSSTEVSDNMSWDGSIDADNSNSFEWLLDESQHTYTACGDAVAVETSCSTSNNNASFKEISRICKAFERGVKIHRKYNLRHKGGGRVFAGYDAVTFLVDRGYATSREQGLLLGRELAVSHALFNHETHDFDLEDDKRLYYVFTPLKKRYINREVELSATSIPAIADAFEEGLVAGTNVYKSRSFKNTFVGREAVTFLVSSQLAKTRQDAARIGQVLMESGLFQHVNITKKPPKFKDKHVLYRFVPQKLRAVHQDCRAMNKDTMPIEVLAQHFIQAVKPGSVFSGSRAIDAMLTAGLALTRSEAISLGEKLASDLHLFHCANLKGRVFLDRSNVYYEYDESSLSEKQNEGQGGEGKLLAELESMGVTVVDATPKNEDCINNSLRSSHSGAFHDSNGDTFDLEHLVVFGANPEKGLAEDHCENESSLTGTRYFDRFGFILENDEDCAFSAVSNDCNENISTTEKELSMEEWSDLLDNCALTDDGGKASAAFIRLVKESVRNGLPDSLRRKAWTVITGVDAMVEEREGEYQSLLETATRFMDEDECTDAQGVIERDLRRTFPRHVLFCEDTDDCEDEDADDCNVDVDISYTQSVGDILAGSGGSKTTPDGVVSLRNVLYAYSIYDNEVAYCQGMNFIGEAYLIGLGHMHFYIPSDPVPTFLVVAAMFLTQFSEEESFWLLVAVMSEEPYDMRFLFAEDMAGVQETLYVAEKLVKKFLPKLGRHFENENINMSMFATQWVMTIFTSTFSFDLVVRVWDSFFVEGWKVVYRVILAIMEQAQDDLLGLDMEGILTYLRDEVPSKIDAQRIMKACLKIPLRNRHIRKYSSEWRSEQKYHKRLSDHTDSVESGSESFSSSGLVMKRLHSVGANGKHMAKKLLPGLTTT